MTQVVSDDVLGKFARKQSDWFARVRAGSLDPEEVGRAIQTIIDRQAVYLTPLYVGETISLPSTKGTTTISEKKDVFSSGIDSNFKNWSTDKPSKDTKASSVQVFEMCRNGTFAQLFGSLGDLDRLTLTQGQIVAFCRQHRDKLQQEGYGTFFLFKVGSDRFIADVSVDVGKLGVDFNNFSNDFVWLADDRHRMVVPQLAT